MKFSGDFLSIFVPLIPPKTAYGTPSEISSELLLQTFSGISAMIFQECIEQFLQKFFKVFIRNTFKDVIKNKSSRISSRKPQRFVLRNTFRAILGNSSNTNCCKSFNNLKI